MYKISFRIASLICLFLATGLYSGCKQNNPGETSESIIEPMILTLTPETFVSQRTPEDVVIDVRTAEEYASGHLENALNVDVRSDAFRTEINSLDKDKTYYLYCRTGNRSGQAAEIMKEAGFTSIYNIGGYEDLAEAGVATTQ